MALSRTFLEQLFKGKEVEGIQDIINSIMSENGKSINELKAKNEELTSQLHDQVQKYNELSESTKDYEALKTDKENLVKELSGIKEKESNQAYLNVLKEAGMNEEFISQDIFAKIPKTEKLEDYKAAVTKFLEEKPIYKAEGYTPKKGMIPGKSDTPFDPNGSDEDVLKYVKNGYQNK